MWFSAGLRQLLIILMIPKPAVCTYTYVLHYQTFPITSRQFISECNCMTRIYLYPNNSIPRHLFIMKHAYELVLPDNTGCTWDVAGLWQGMPQNKSLCGHLVLYRIIIWHMNSSEGCKPFHFSLRMYHRVQIRQLKDCLVYNMLQIEKASYHFTIENEIVY